MKAAVAVSIFFALAVACLMAKPSNAIGCGDVDASLGSCIAYLTGQQPKPDDQCCSGVRRLKDMAITTADKQSACECVKAAATRLQNLKDEYVSALPGQCGAPLPFPISRSFDCSK